MFNIIELIYPNVCGFCNKICKTSICKKCEIKIKKLEKNYKIDCSNKYFNEAFSIFQYKGIIREKIIDYKFNDKPYLYKTFGKIFLKNKKICGNFKKYDIIIPVPIAKKRKLKRGYNQTQLIARFLAKATGIKCENNVLVKVKNITSQSELTKEQRIKNVQDAFKVLHENKIINKNIILFDDIYTTGSTVNECSKMLKNANVKNICVLTIAKD